MVHLVAVYRLTGCPLVLGKITTAKAKSIFLQPNVAKSILEHEGFTDSELEAKLDAFTTAIIDSVSDKNKEDAVIRFCRRRIDRALRNR